MSTLYELTGDYLQVAGMIDDPDVDAQTIADTLEAIGGEIEDKAENYAKVIANANAERDGLANEIDRLTRRKRAIDENTKRMKEALQQAMQVTGKTKFKTPLFSFGIQKNPTSVQIEEGATIPDKYLIAQEPKIDRKGMIADLKEGIEIKGCTLTQSESLRIR